jgi:hypothetical protein
MKTLHIFSFPAGPTIVGEEPARVSPRGWVIYSGLGYCPPGALEK